MWCFAGGDAVGCRSLQVGLVGRYGVDACREYEPLLVARAGLPTSVEKRDFVTSLPTNNNELLNNTKRDYRDIWNEITIRR